jgi:hypothetical protein
MTFRKYTPFSSPVRRISASLPEWHMNVTCLCRPVTSKTKKLYWWRSGRQEEMYTLSEAGLGNNRNSLSSCGLPAVVVGQLIGFPVCWAKEPLVTLQFSQEPPVPVFQSFRSNVLLPAGFFA